MVDFNSKELFTANKSEILNLIILGRRDELINTFQLWREKVFANSGEQLKLEHKLRSCLFSIYLELEQPLTRKLDKEQIILIEDVVLTNQRVEEKEILTAFKLINGFLDDINLTKIDVKRKYDTTDLEAENEAKGL